MVEEDEVERRRGDLAVGSLELTVVWLWAAVLADSSVPWTML